MLDSERLVREDRLEGRNPVAEALRAGRTIHKLWVARRAGRPDPALARLVARARESGATIIETDRAVLDRMSESHGHQGIIAQVAAHTYADLDQILQELDSRGEAPFLLALAEIQESYNLGSILRIADAAGVHAVIIPQHRSVGLDAAVAKASAGAIEYVPVCRVGNLTQTLIRLKQRGVWIAAADAAARQPYQAADWSGPLAIVIGGESAGISPALLRHTDFQVAIPMLGQVNSLNASVAAGIIVFAAVASRQRKAVQDNQNCVRTDGSASTADTPALNES